MKLDVKAMAMACVVMWGILGMLLVGVVNVFGRGYGQAFLDLAASFYPGYRAEPTFGQVALATAYGLIDGALCGALLAWTYNRFAGATRANVNPA